jgi:hypothetical protein
MIVFKDKLVKVGNSGIVGTGIKGHPVHRKTVMPQVSHIMNPMAKMNIGSGFVSTTQLKRKPINFL